MFLRSSAGFILIEWWVSWLLVSILLVMGFCGGRYWISSLRAMTVATAVTHMLRTAQLAAVSLRQRVLVCSSRDGLVCDQQWSSGYILLVAQSGEVLFSLSNLLHSHVVWRGSLGRGLSFLADGRPDGEQGHFCYRDDYGVLGWKLFILRTGSCCDSKY